MPYDDMLYRTWSTLECYHNMRFLTFSLPSLDSVSNFGSSACWFSSSLLRGGSFMVHCTMSKEKAGLFVLIYLLCLLHHMKEHILWWKKSDHFVNFNHGHFSLWLPKHLSVEILRIRVCLCVKRKLDLKSKWTQKIFAQLLLSHLYTSWLIYIMNLYTLGLRADGGGKWAEAEDERKYNFRLKKSRMIDDWAS